MPKSNKRIEWEARMEEWKKSGLSAAQWCREHDINIHQMYYWKQRLRKADEDMQEASWLPVQWKESSTTTKNSPIFIHVHDYAVEVPTDADPIRVSEILRALT